MQRDVALARDDGLVEHAAGVIGEGLHQERLAAPFRIRMLAVDFLEFLRGVLVFLLVQEREALIVEDVRRLVGRDRVLVDGGAGGEPAREQAQASRNAEFA